MRHQAGAQSCNTDIRSGIGDLARTPPLAPYPRHRPAVSMATSSLGLDGALTRYFLETAGWSLNTRNSFCSCRVLPGAAFIKPQLWSRLSAVSQVPPADPGACRVPCYRCFSSLGMLGAQIPLTWGRALSWASVYLCCHTSHLVENVSQVCLPLRVTESDKKKLQMLPSPTQSQSLC